MMPSRLSNLFSIIVILSSCTITVTVVASEPFQFQFQSRHQCNDDETRAHPHHCHLMELAATTPKEFATDFHNWAKHIGFVVDQGTSTSAKHPELELDGTAVKTVKRNLRDAGGVGKKKEVREVLLVPAPDRLYLRMEWEILVSTEAWNG